jgi:hypothetical protein
MKTFRLILILAVPGMGGCATFNPVRVQPWQREALADDAMNPGRDPVGRQMAEHIHFSREAASGGGGVGGSGCGCN